MRNVYFALLFFSFSFSFGCSMPEDQKDKKIVESKKHERKDPFHQLCQYWEVTDADNPTFRDLFDNHTEGIYDFPGIIFMTDSTFLENPRAAMRYGKFVLKGKTIDAQFDDGKKAVYTIQNIEGTKMILRRAEKGHSTILNLKESKVFWPNARLNPFNKMNSAWRIKPSRKETPAELNERLKECVQFYEYFFRGYSESESDEIDFLGLPSCFKWYQGGIYVQGPKNLDKKWINCFYDEEQAFQARQMMEDVVLKKYDWDTKEKNWLKQTADVLKQIHDKM
jgi:ribosome-associated toxin RatA of RatAB toxin-antitoxin module